MKTQSTRTRLLASSMICGAAVLAGGQAFAQDQGTQVEEFVVTGSRIPQPNLTSTSPITVVGDKEAKLQGTTNVETLINNLPQAFADMTSTASNGATGTATVNLRDLGPARTLVLVDGKRLMPSDAALPVADLNNIPAALVDHVEVVTGGASAVYGSDALAGVVNFVMKKDFEGVRLDAQYGFVQHNQHNDEAQAAANATGGLVKIPDDFSGGATWDITAIVGVNSPDGKGNATVYAGYRHMDAVTQDKYDFTNCSFSSVKTNGVYDHHKCAGSANYNLIESPLLNDGVQNYNFFAETNRTFSPYAGQTFNFGPYNFLQRPDERYTLGGFAHYEISPMFDVYTDVMFADDHTVAQIAPSGLFLGSGTNNGLANINCDNPLMSAQQAAAIGCGTVVGPTDQIPLFIGRRNIEGGPRITDLRHTSYRIDLGTRGDLGHGWSYDVYGQYGLTLLSSNLTNELSKNRVQNALIVDIDPTTGLPACRVAISGQDPSCVPLDIFGGLGAFTPEMLNYVSAQGFQSGTSEEQIVSASLTGDLGQYGLKSPAASDGVGIALGAEYRREALKLDTSRDFQINDLYGSGGATLPVPLSSFDVKEFYGEIRIPLVQDATFAKLLQFEGGFRHSDYSSVGGTDAWKLAGDWQPIDDIRLRASYQKAVRAPNVLESFAPNNNVLFGFQDPCSGPTPLDTLAQCQNTGVSAAQYGHVTPCPSAQCKNVVGGNANLKPETSTTKSFGVVFTPTFFRGFNASIDYFDIEVKDLIATYGGSFLFNTCANTGDPTICALINRDPNGLLFTDATNIINTTKNTGFIHTKGLDFEANYRTSFSDLGMGDAGSLSFNFVGTYTDSLEIQPIPANIPGGGGSYDCAGLFGTTCGTPVPKWRHKLRVTWTSPWNVGLSVNWRYMSGVDFDELDANPLLASGRQDTIDAHIKSYNYFDLAATWAVRDGTTLRAGVNNVFDKDPPLVDTNAIGISSPPFGNGNTYPGVYDSLGRTFFIGITADF